MGKKTNSLTSHHGESNNSRADKMSGMTKRFKKYMKGHTKRFFKKFYGKKRRAFLKNVDNDKI
mgnify:CR=1 FL=1|tara:strand:- start:8916 stop:9104 length:189 start_codon:yes stop_codon:yes gene_type:complete